MATYGYARVSGPDQSTATQVERLKAAGCEVVRKEKASGKSRDGRDELANLLEFVRDGDVLCVVKLDRLGRSTRDVLNLAFELEQRGASLRVLEPEIDTAGPMGKMVMTVLGMVAEMELGFIRDRQRAGIEAAKVRGVYKGRPASIKPAEVAKLKSEGLGASEIAKCMGVSRASVYRALDSGR
jgi:DNA invertase Pin-like site-specific DNA recombinase